MSKTVDSVDITCLRKAHFTQLLSYLNDRDETDWYYGNRQQFEKRHQELKHWLESIINIEFNTSDKE